MSRGPTPLDERLYDYLLSVTPREHDVLAALRAETAVHPRAGMQISRDQGAFLQLLVRLLGAKRTLEVGVFTGYSSLAVALALPADGRLVACDVSEEFTAVARRHWARAGVGEKIDLRLAPALDTLDGLLHAGEADRFDFAFIDADKTSYDGYYERALRLVRRGGLVAFDNVLWHGKVADPSAGDPDTAALRALNAKLRDDPRVAVSLVPIGDGLTLALRLV